MGMRLPYITASLLAVAVLEVGARKPAATGADAGPAIVKAEQALPMTCVQAWAASRQRYPEMLAVVKALAKVSLANRDLTFPNTREAGLDAGKGIAEDCKADPNALLFAVVDKHVRRIAEEARD
jgi:hypothetical protein